MIGGNPELRTNTEISDHDPRVVESSFEARTGLSADVMANIILQYQYVKLGEWDFLGEIKTYEDHFRETVNANTLRQIMEKSDRDKVREFDEIVTEYNQAVHEIKSTRDKQRFTAFYDRLNQLVRGN